MGYLTPILFRNDYIHELVSDPEQLAKIVHDASVSSVSKSYGFVAKKKNEDRRWWQFWKSKTTTSGILANPVKALKSKHADSNRVILVNGNSWIDLSEYIHSTKWRVSEEYIEEAVKIAQRHVSELKKVLKARQEKGN
jgi:hypothetical protein